MDITNIFDGIGSDADNEDVFVGSDGLKHCKVCGMATQKKIVLFGSEKLVGCICDCGVKELERKKEVEQKEELERKQMICFADTNMASWNFENDDRSDAKISDAMRRYADNFDTFLKDGKGLLLYGPVGTGKTYYASCIANKLLKDGYSVLLTNFSKLTNQIQSTFDAKQELIDSLSKYSLVIIDDLGIERRSEYMQEIVFSIIDARYRSGKPVIITTNIPMDEMKKPKELSYKRIYDRVFEMCHPVKIDGDSRRMKKVRTDYFKMNEMLGL